GPNRPLTAAERVPVVAEVRVVHANGDGSALYPVEPGSFEQPGKTVGKRKRSGEQLVPRDSGSSIDTSGGIPKDSLVNETAAEIPHRGHDGTAGYNYALDFVQCGKGIRDKIENKLGCGAAKRRILVRQLDSVRHLEVEICRPQLRSRESDILGRYV